MRYMLDTNICIYLIKNKDKCLLNNLEKHDYSEICISTVTYSELIYGVEKSACKQRNTMALIMLLSHIDILNYDVDAASCYGKIRADLEIKGTPIGALDMMIAAHAKSLDYTLVTNNEREFKRIGNLKVENWTSQN